MRATSSSRPVLPPRVAGDQAAHGDVSRRAVQRGWPTRRRRSPVVRCQECGEQVVQGYPLTAVRTSTSLLMPICARVQCDRLGLRPPSSSSAPRPTSPFSARSESARRSSLLVPRPRCSWSTKSANCRWSAPEPTWSSARFSRYARGSMTITSNKSFIEWTARETDDVLAPAILDRLLHHCDVLTINGPRCRLKDRLSAAAELSHGEDLRWLVANSSA